MKERCGDVPLSICSGYFNALSNALEMKARIRSVNDKITYAAEVRTRSVFNLVSFIDSILHRCNQFSANC